MRELAERDEDMQAGSRAWGDTEGSEERHEGRLLLSLMLIAAGWLVLGWPWLSGRVTIPWDAKAHFQPQIQFLAASLAAGDWPFWAPYVFSGHPQIADPQSLIFSPPFLLLALVNGAPSLWAVDATVLLAVLAGMAGVALYFDERRWHWGGAVIAALAFGFGAAMAWRIQHTNQVLSLALLPLVLWSLERALSRRSAGWGTAAGVLGAFLVLGRDQVALLAVYLLVAYVVWRIVDSGELWVALRRAIWPLGWASSVGLLLAAGPVLLTLLLAAESNRPAIDFAGAGAGSLHPAQLATLVAADLFGAAGRMEDYWGPPSFAWPGTGLFVAQNMGVLYVGALPVLLVVLGTARGYLWERQIAFFSVALLAVLLYALGWYTPVFRGFYEVLPGVSLYRRPADAAFLIGALLAMLAGYVAHRLLSDPLPVIARREWGILSVAVLSGLAVCPALAVFRQRGDLAAGQLVTAAVSYVAALAVLAWVLHLRPLYPRAAVLVLAAGLVTDLGWSNGPNGATALPPAHYEVLEPASRNETIAKLESLVAAGASDTRRDRIELLGLGFHWPNASLTHKLENTLGYNPVRLSLYSRATGAEDHAGLPEQRKFSALLPSYRSRLADLLGLRYIASPVPLSTIDKRLAADPLPIVARTKEAAIYENRGALPRVLFATEARRADFEAILATGQWPPFDPATTVLLDGVLPSTLGERDGARPRWPGWVRIASYRNSEVVIEADSPDGGFVVLNDVWQRWWTAEVDGREVDLLRANALFRAVAVPPGRHQVRFVFRPWRGLLDVLLAGAGRMAAQKP
jgi:hypothetical protein